MTGCALLRAAIDFCRRGWSVIPVRPSNKRAAVTWKRYQRQAADERDLRDWFRDADPELLAIGIVGGEVSGGLAVADFDVAGSYERCGPTAHPDLARALPTVRTGRPGRHVYFRCEGLPSCKTPYGDVKAEGGYVVAPPSLHPSGRPYCFEIPLAGPLPLIDPIGAGLLSPGEGAGQATHRDISPCVASDLCLPLDLAIERAIQKSLPTHAGERHDCLFTLVRRLKGIPELADSDPSARSRSFAAGTRPRCQSFVPRSFGKRGANLGTAGRGVSYQSGAANWSGRSAGKAGRHSVRVAHSAKPA